MPARCWAFCSTACSAVHRARRRWCCARNFSAAYSAVHPGWRSSKSPHPFSAAYSAVHKPGPATRRALLFLSCPFGSSQGRNAGNSARISQHMRQPAHEKTQGVRVERAKIKEQQRNATEQPIQQHMRHRPVPHRLPDCSANPLQPVRGRRPDNSRRDCQRVDCCRQARADRDMCRPSHRSGPRVASKYANSGPALSRRQRLCKCRR